MYSTVIKILPHLHNLFRFPPQSTPCTEDLQENPGPQLFHLYMLQCAPQKKLGVFFHNHSAIITNSLSDRILLVSPVYNKNFKNYEQKISF